MTLNNLTIAQKLELESELKSQVLILINLAEKGQYPNLQIAAYPPNDELEIEYDYENDAMRIAHLFMKAENLDFQPSFYLDNDYFGYGKIPAISFYSRTKKPNMPLISLAYNCISEQFENWLLKPPAKNPF